tara:strand:- start:1311 stop:1541 length:231 start_codon:yes stop_codon:yes gene_type:complete
LFFNSVFLPYTPVRPVFITVGVADECFSDAIHPTVVTASRRFAQLPWRASSWPESGHDEGRVVDTGASRRFGSAGQ